MRRALFDASAQDSCIPDIMTAIRTGQLSHSVVLPKDLPALHANIGPLFTGGNSDIGRSVAIHFATRIVLGDYPSSTVDDLIAQIEYVVEIGGIDTVGLGPDFFEYGDDSRGRNVMVNQGASPMPWTADLEDTGKLRNLTRALAARGYRDADILKILGGNLMRVFESALG